MYYKDRRRIHFLYLSVDLFLIGLSFYLPWKLNPALVPQSLLELRPYFSIFALWAFSLIFLLNNVHLYSTDRSLSISREWWLVVRCVLFSSILAALFIFTLKVVIFSRLVFILATFLLVLCLPTWRTIKRILVRHLIKNGYSNLNILIVGAGKAGLELSEEIHSNPYLGLRIVGFLDDNKTLNVNGFKILGSINDLEEVVKKNFIDEVYITIPSERKLASDVLLKAIKLGKTVRIIAERFELPNQQVGLNYIGVVPLITYYERGLHGTEHAIKRLIDIAASAVLLILFSPLFLIIAFLIKLESPGPVFFISKRSGKKGQIFNFYKFRSMVDGADSRKEALRHKSEVKGPIFKIRKDPRVTEFGGFLRRYSLDELPQLINVLRGDMSLVGPRPFPVEESQKLENRHMPRLNIKPGITGLAQIKGRSDLSFHKWAKWDLWYFNHWSFGLDLKILWWTIPAVIKGRGAY